MSEITTLNQNNVYLATAASCVRNIKLTQILYKILNQILIATEMTLQKIKTVIVNLISVY